jgi:hypothetical protein
MTNIGFYTGGSKPGPSKSDAVEELVEAAKCATAALDILLRWIDDESHPGWKTVQELVHAIKLVEGR